MTTFLLCLARKIFYAVGLATSLCLSFLGSLSLSFCRCLPFFSSICISISVYLSFLSFFSFLCLIPGFLFLSFAIYHSLALSLNLFSPLFLCFSIFRVIIQLSLCFSFFPSLSLFSSLCKFIYVSLSVFFFLSLYIFLSLSVILQLSL